MIKRRFICGIMVICLLFSTILPSSAMAAETTHDMMPVG